ncbi:MAG: chloride channel protein [Planctomycetota bacterium]|nr:chloride channel protein [Planctomycetota bacterium]
MISLAPSAELKSLGRLLILCLFVGLAAGLGAAAFYAMLECGRSFFLEYLANYRPQMPGNEERLFENVGSITKSPGILRWVLLIVPAVGGLISGLLVFSLAPEAEGHGTDHAIEAYHFKDGAVRKRVPLIKAIASAITIGSGGSGGREGPIAQIGAGFGSMLGRWLKLSPTERRVLMAAGMAAGIGAIFHAPLAGALFAAEVMYRELDFEHEVLVPAFMSSIVAYSVFGAIFGFHSLFQTPPYEFNQVTLLLPYFILAVVSALGAMLFVRAFYSTRKLMFERIKLPNHVKPAIGGLAVGIIGFFIPEALGSGYGVVQLCFADKIDQLPTAVELAKLLPAGTDATIIAAMVLGGIALAKIATTSFSIGSGGSGGVFGPSVTIGGALGGATGLLCARFFPGLDISPGAFALVGMAGFFAGAANTPVSTIIMVSEMTGNYNLLVPSMLVCIVAYLLCRKFTLYDKQLASRLDAPTKLGNMAGAILRQLTVGQAVADHRAGDLILVAEQTGFRELLQKYTNSTQVCFPVVDPNQKLTGVIDSGDIRRIVTETGVADLIIARDIERPARTIKSEDSLLSAVNMIAKTDTPALIVVEQEETRTVVGILGRGDIIAAYNRQIAVPAQ